VEASVGPVELNLLLGGMARDFLGARKAGEVERERTKARVVVPWDCEATKSNSLVSL